MKPFNFTQDLALVWLIASVSGFVLQTGMRVINLLIEHDPKYLITLITCAACAFVGLVGLGLDALTKRLK